MEEIAIFSCRRCGRRFKLSELTTHVKENPTYCKRNKNFINSAKTGFYCLPCWKKTEREQLIGFLIGLTILFVIVLLLYILPKFFRTKKKSRKR